jgi:hypothetical protein
MPASGFTLIFLYLISPTVPTVAHVNLLKQFKTGTGWVMKSIPRKSNGPRDWGALPDGSYFIEWREEGKRMRLPAGRTVSQALGAQRIKLAEIAGTEVGILQRYRPLPPPSEPEPIRLSAQIRRYLDQSDTLKKPNTYRKYDAVLKSFDQHFPGRTLETISVEELNDFVVKRKSLEMTLRYLAPAPDVHDRLDQIRVPGAATNAVSKKPPARATRRNTSKKAQGQTR